MQQMLFHFPVQFSTIQLVLRAAKTFCALCNVKFSVSDFELLDWHDLLACVIFGVLYDFVNECLEI